MTLMDDIEYLSLRERQERAAAKRAMGPAARQHIRSCAALRDEDRADLGQQPAEGR